MLTWGDGQGKGQQLQPPTVCQALDIVSMGRLSARSQILAPSPHQPWDLGKALNLCVPVSPLLALGCL